MDGSRGHEQAGRGVGTRRGCAGRGGRGRRDTRPAGARGRAWGRAAAHGRPRALKRSARARAEHAAGDAAAARRRAHPRKAGRLRGAPATRGSGRERRRLSAAGPPEAVGAWDGAPRTITRNGRANESLPAIHSILLPTGKVLMFGPPLGPATPREPRVNESVAVLFDPVTRTFEDVPPPVDPRTGMRSNIYCSGGVAAERRPRAASPAATSTSTRASRATTRGSTTPGRSTRGRSSGSGTRTSAAATTRTTSRAAAGTRARC